MEFREWKPSPSDVRVLCEAVLHCYIDLSAEGRDHCIYCGTEYGNVHFEYMRQGKQEPHDNDCPVLIARDVLAGIPE